MSNSVQMPALGESVTEGTVTRWLKQVGDDVAVDEPLVEISTDKVDTEIPSPFAGVLEKIVVAEDETAEVGAELAVIGDGSGASADPKEADSSDPVAEPGPSAPADSDAESDAQPEPEAAPAAEVTEPAETPSEDVEAPAEKPVAETKPAGGSGTAVTLPAMGESVTEGTVTRWLKQVGDDVAVDEPLVEISTDKVDTEVPSPIAGTLLEISVGEDETVEVGGRLGIIGEKGSTATAAPEPDAAPEPAAAAPEPKAQAPAAPAKQAAPAAPAAPAA
ncbi:MAG: 2-oxoglutarate dehydrogenase, E2 component, dihydrolipoamide succinyltransferase, partial [Actinomycetota bacterium]|nr:2-oxoglutarate dehydrogenase, E2 component, dihydrolipoamide succinyltransferase [Actinomycetota bacterium]